MSEMDPLYESSDAAIVLGVTPHTVRVARRRGDITPAVVSTRGTALYTREELMRYAARRSASESEKQKRDRARREALLKYYGGDK